MSNLHRNPSGFSLIEMIIFIVIIGIIGTTLLLSLQSTLDGSNTPVQILKANRLAMARMNLILQYRHLVGVSAMSDPCSAGTPPAACTLAQNYASSQNLTVTSAISTIDSQHKGITVTVDGAGYAQLQAEVANYEAP